MTKNLKIIRTNTRNPVLTAGTYQTCHAVLDCPTDAYEWSFVAVPAQREAGVIKALTLTGNGGERKMEDVIKNLASGSAVTLSKQETAELTELIKNIKEQAKTGSFYKEELKSEMLRLSSVVQPELNPELMIYSCRGHYEDK